MDYKYEPGVVLICWHGTRCVTRTMFNWLSLGPQRFIFGLGEYLDTNMLVYQT